MELKEKTDNLLDHAGDYLDTYYKLALLNITEKTTTVSSAIIGVLLLVVFGIFVLFFAGLGLSWWIGGLLGNIVAGYNIIFLVCGSSFLIAWIIIHFLVPTMERIKL